MFEAVIMKYGEGDTWIGWSRVARRTLANGWINLFSQNVNLFFQPMRLSGSIMSLFPEKMFLYCQQMKSFSEKMKLFFRALFFSTNAKNSLNNTVTLVFFI